MKTTKFPTIYKKTSTGAIESWSISVLESTIITDHGQVDGKQQTSTDTLAKGKNAGKTNATTAAEQALLEAEAKWTKKKKAGYVESIEAAQAGETDDLIEGGILPMLAHKYSEQSKKIKYFAYGQRKYDGTRCVAILKNGKCTLWSRTRKPINSMPHIVKAIETNFKTDITLDGELYANSFDKNFEGLISLVRSDEAVDGHEAMQYHIYDIINDNVYAARLGELKGYALMGVLADPLVFVETVDLDSEEKMLEYFGQFIDEGFEGLMVRNAEGRYKHGRSYDLQKVKSMLDEDFPIIGVKDGRGKMAGKAIFVCQLPNGGTVDVKMKGKLDDLAKYMTNESLWRSKKLTVQFQGWTGDRSLRFPVGLRIRDSLDF